MKIKPEKAWILSCILVIAGLSHTAGYPQAYTNSRPCECRGNPGLKNAISAGNIEVLFEYNVNNGAWEKWSSSMLRPDGRPPKKLPPEKDEVGESLIAYDGWSCQYSAFSAVDGNPKTAWVEGAGGDGIGEMLIVKVNTGEPVEIWAGIGASAGLFKANNRPRKIRVSVFQADAVPGAAQDGMLYSNLNVLSRHELELKDINGYQPLPLPGHTLDKKKGASFIAIEILSVYRGAAYRDTGITEVRNRGRR